MCFTSGTEACPFTAGMPACWSRRCIFARVKRKHIADVLDFLAPLPGIGLMAGRIGNFINGELWGKPTDLPWGFGVPNAERSARLRGTPRSSMRRRSRAWCCSLILWWFTAKPRPRLAPTGLFLLVYGCARFAVEWVRLPDAQHRLSGRAIG